MIPNKTNRMGGQKGVSRQVLVLQSKGSEQVTAQVPPARRLRA